MAIVNVTSRMLIMLCFCLFCFFVCFFKSFQIDFNLFLNNCWIKWVFSSHLFMHKSFFFLLLEGLICEWWWKKMFWHLRKCCFNSKHDRCNLLSSWIYLWHEIFVHIVVQVIMFWNTKKEKIIQCTTNGSEQEL